MLKYTVLLAVCFSITEALSLRDLLDNQKRQSGFIGRGLNGRFLFGRDSIRHENKRQSGFIGRGPNGRFLIGRDLIGHENKRQSGFIGRGPNGRFLVGRDSIEHKNKRQSGFIGRGPNGRFLVGRENERKSELFGSDPKNQLLLKMGGKKVNTMADLENALRKELSKFMH